MAVPPFIPNTRDPLKVHHGQQCHPLLAQQWPHQCHCPAHADHPPTPSDEPWFRARPEDPNYPDDNKCGHYDTPEHDDYHVINRHASARVPPPHDEANRSKCQCIECLPNFSVSRSNHPQDDDYAQCWTVHKAPPRGPAKKRHFHDEIIKAAKALDDQEIECKKCLDPATTEAKHKAVDAEHQWPRGQTWCQCDELTETLPKRLRQNIKSAELAEQKGMTTAARETEVQNQFAWLEARTIQIEAQMEDLRKNNITPWPANSHGEGRPEPKFRSGESVLQFWAGWMATAKEPPLQLNTNKRGKWYSASILGWARYGDIKYAGIQYYDQHIYYAY